MNPFFWLLVLIGAVALWFALRGLFIQLGDRASGLLNETADLLDIDEEHHSEDENGGNEHA